MDEARTKHPLRCAACPEKPLLAVYGIDARGNLYIHQRVYKGSRVYAESLFYGGIARLKCRICHRWNKVVFRDKSTAELEPTKPPEGLVGETR